ncbi:T9SS type B sorting domain-containing protein [Tenacibaculum sp. M341]|uniref:T9SS type B sorting domain-containing protein n=1 Tax=Tenacibaculum sp. M341 TaxID=2530339 RepID=UPI001049AA8A|nr:T9SS type B sorting domain-containing protein [Tenacibaculum sp. M341]TCI89939.1 T9SS type B sorting domain-containing protein [Tenacibaculum sp. M341]
MKKTLLFLIYFSLILFANAQDGASTCDAAEPMCSDDMGVKIFDNVTGKPNTGTIACLSTTPNPAWFFIRVESSGRLEFQIIQAQDFDAAGNVVGNTLDVDFTSWGPFTAPDGNCSSLATTCVDTTGAPTTCVDNTFDPDYYINNEDGTNIMDCSYSGSAIESFTIENAVAGEFYILLITNFQDSPGKIKLEQTNLGTTGAGETDCSIIAGELGPDQTVCDGTTITLDGTPSTGTATSYEWQIDTGAGFTTIAGETGNTLTINNDKSGTYRVIITDDVGGTATDDIDITFLPVPVANKPADINFCDSDSDGFHTFDLQNDVTPLVLGAQSAIQFEVVYFLSQTDADNNNTANALANPYTNSTANSTQTIYARIHNTSNPDTCFDTTSFSLDINSLPTPRQPSDIVVCNDLGNPVGFYNNFILATKDNEILGGLSPTQYSVSYHTTLAGAQTNATTDVIDKNIAYTNIIPNEQVIFVRVENSSNTSCSVATTVSSATFKPFKLVVNPLPVIINPIVQIEQCENDGDFTAIINLTQAQINISNNHLNETFKYYTSEVDANTDNAPIADPINYNATNGEVVWVRTISDKDCFRVSQINVIISFAADIMYDKEFTECDDFLDADGNNTPSNDDTDGITNFDFSIAEGEIINLFDPAIRSDLKVLFFETQADRDAVTNEIADISKYRNTNFPGLASNTIYIKIINKINNNCTGLSKLFVRVLPLPSFDVTSPQILCLNNLSSIEAESPGDTYAYEWTRNGNATVIGNNQTLNLTQGGEYKVTAINTTTLCKRSRIIFVNESIIATINQNDVSIIDDSDNNTITINNDTGNLGIGAYEFALQDENGQIVQDYQDEPKFENLQGGIYTILVRDKNNCGIAELDVSVLEFPDFFTPNEDSINDTWNVKGANSLFYPSNSIYIFDRYGKLLTSLKVDDQGWNGTYNGNALPSNDYWFNIELTDRNGNVITRKGHFSLLLD